MFLPVNTKNYHLIVKELATLLPFDTAMESSTDRFENQIMSIFDHGRSTALGHMDGFADIYQNNFQKIFEKTGQDLSKSEVEDNLVGCCVCSSCASEVSVLNLERPLDLDLDLYAATNGFESNTLLDVDSGVFTTQSGTGNGSSSVELSGNRNIDALLSTGQWTDSTIDYAFPQSLEAFNYSVNEPVVPFDANYQAAAHFALSSTIGNAASAGFSFEGFTVQDVNFLGSTDNSNAHIRLTTVEGGTGAQVIDFPNGMFSENVDDDGDIFIGTDLSWAGTETTIQAGNAHWQTVLHEIGHALGLKHSFFGDAIRNDASLPRDLDTYDFTVMTFVTQDVGDQDWPQSFMMLDIAALQYMYGANYNINSDDTVYSWSPGSGDTLVNGQIAIDASGDTIFATIWDGGGFDTYDLSAFTTDLQIDLRAGQSSVFAQDQLASLRFGNQAQGNIYNALLYEDNTDSLIEAALGGSGNDSFLGNQGNNVFFGGEGNDFINGGGGTYNQAEYEGGLADYRFTQNSDGSVTVTGPQGTDTLIDIDGVWFRGEASWYSISDAVAGLGGNTGGGNTGETAFPGTVGQDIYVATRRNEFFDGGDGIEYDQVDYEGSLSDYTFTQNADGSVTAEGFGSTDTLTNIEGLWFQGEAAWYSIDQAVALTGSNGENGNSGGVVFNGTAEQDIFVATNVDESFNGGNGIEYDQVDYQGALSDYTFTQNADGSVTVEGLGSTDTLTNIEGLWFQGEAAWYSVVQAVALTSGSASGAGNVFNGTNDIDVFVATNANETFNGGTGIEYDQVDYAGSAVDYDVVRNADGSFSVTGQGSTDTLINIEGIWFQGSAEWASLDSLL